MKKWIELAGSDNWFWRNVKRNFQNKVAKWLAGIVALIIVAAVVLLVLAFA